MTFEVPRPREDSSEAGLARGHAERSPNPATCEADHGGPAELSAFGLRGVRRGREQGSACVVESGLCELCEFHGGVPVVDHAPYQGGERPGQNPML